MDSQHCIGGEGNFKYVFLNSHNILLLIENLEKKKKDTDKKYFIPVY